MNKKLLKRAFIAGVAVGIIAAATIWFSSDREKDVVLGPEETVEAFCRAVTTGDFEKAESLCDSISMQRYLESHMEAWDEIQKEDSTALAIASDILSNAVINTLSVEKDGDRRIVVYTLEADGHRKERKAVVRKEEGEWKVEAITDRN